MRRGRTGHWQVQQHQPTPLLRQAEETGNGHQQTCSKSCNRRWERLGGTVPKGNPPAWESRMLPRQINLLHLQRNSPT